MKITMAAVKPHFFYPDTQKQVHYALRRVAQFSSRVPPQPPSSRCERPRGLSRWRAIKESGLIVEASKSDLIRFSLVSPYYAYVWFAFCVPGHNLWTYQFVKPPSGNNEDCQKKFEECFHFLEGSFEDLAEIAQEVLLRKSQKA